MNLTLREIDYRLKSIREFERERTALQAKFHGLEMKKPTVKMKHDQKLDDAVREKISGRVNLRNRNTGKPR